MSDKSGNKNILIIAGVVVALVVGYFIYKESQKETVSVSIGDSSISATVE